MMPRAPEKPVKRRAPRAAQRGVPAILARHLAAELAVPGRTKRAAVRLALARAIRSGQLREGQALPSEQALGEILGVSLGTVQAALRQLQQTGVIVRRRGQGSRIASTEPLDPIVWHFRFERLRDRAPLHLVTDWIDIDAISGGGPWSEYLLGGDATAYVRIRRRYAAPGWPAIGAEMYLIATLVPGLARMPSAELASVNIRPFLQERFGIATLGADHRVSLVKLGKTVASSLGLALGASCYEIHARAYSHERRPVYFQRIYAPTKDYALNFAGPHF
jgi:DNA-binding GntR family transcriptional regulator